MQPTQPWIGKPATDILFILLPPFVCLLLIVLFPSVFSNTSGIPDAAWVVLILLIDVAHVYSTLFRTYFDKAAFRKQRTLLLAIPLIGFGAGVLVYSVSAQLFWRLLAYVAIFHFVRQQYGFMRVYSRREQVPVWMHRVDTITIYTATVYPVLYWHLRGPRHFNWFIDDDLVYFRSGNLLSIAGWLYVIILAVWISKEIMLAIRHRYINLPRILVISGTLLSWYMGIVFFNGDMAFTLLNVVSHGIPYMALVWMYGKKHYAGNQKGGRFLAVVFSRWGWVLFLCLLFLFAFIEEGLWDFTVWKEHRSIFATGISGNHVFSNEILAFIVPLLAVPQLTHYILDGFIWKIKQDDFRWSGAGKKG